MGEESTTVEVNEKLDQLNLERFYVIVNCVAKKQNVGQMIRSACAFGVCEILVAGSAKNVQYFGAQGTQKHINIRHFDKLDEAVAYAKEKNCKICGVEIKDESKSIVGHPFTKGENIAFILGNEGRGLSEKQCAACDFFTYIPHFGDGTASLNVTVAASIVFHHFSTWAGYPERERSGEKFVVKERRVKRGVETELDKQKHEERQRKKMALAAQQN